MQVYRQEILYGERSQISIEIALAEKLEAREMELYQQRSDSSGFVGYYTLWVHQIKTPIAAGRSYGCRSGRPPTEAAVGTKFSKSIPIPI